MTFNPGWDKNGIELDSFTDVRDIQRELTFESEADGNTKGPASFIILDPDGNPILIDQHE